ncbi:MAG: hypothetical protein Q8L10_01520, partial [Candidatus Moranbacteria bacterium]|nr:hypothetical protein [Candidatus Moranbacteria bacterium]
MKLNIAKNILWITAAVFFSVIGASSASASTVTRSFSNPTPTAGSTLTVSLAVDLVSPDSFYFIDEVLPIGWTIADPGTGDTAHPGHIKWIVINGATSTVYNYTVNVPADISGIYTFSGEYGFDSNAVPVQILGETSVDVQAVVGSNVVRSFSSSLPVSGSILTVSLAVNLNVFDSFYIIDEVLPIGWTVADPGTGDITQPGHIKWIVISGATSTVYNYTVNVPAGISGIYTFSGEYAFDSNAVPVQILGETSVDVQATAADTIAPVITLNGTDPMTVEVGATYTEPGATWTDNVDGTGS